MQNQKQTPTTSIQIRHEKYKNLGIYPVLPSTTVNPMKNVKVKLRTAAGHKELEVSDAFGGFADANFDADNQLVKIPESFSYNKKIGPKTIHGFPGEKVKGLDNWSTLAGGNRAEEMVYDHLVMALKKPGLIINGLEIRDTLKVVKQNINEDVAMIMSKNQHLLGHEVTPDEWALAASLNINQVKVMADATKAFTVLCGNIPGPAIDFASIQTNYTLMSEGDKKVLKEIVSSLKKEFEKQTKNNRKPLIKEVEEYIIRATLKKELDRNQEFDFVASQRNTKTLAHIEVKSYPQKGAIDPEGLKAVFKEACEQIDKGKDFIEKILAPSAELTTEWTRVSLVWFPEIPNKKPFEDLNIDKDILKYILTGEDIGSDQWWTSLGLIPASTDDGSYKRLFSFLVGSAHVSIDSQVYDWSKDRREVNEKLVGATCLGLGGEMIPKVEPQSKDIKGKHLGHAYNIIFWNRDQKILNKRRGHNVLVGDYGGGKSSLIIGAALREAEDLANTVVFISAAAADPMTGLMTELYPVFDEALELKFEGTRVKVFSLHSLIKRYNLAKSASLRVIIEAFLGEFGGPDLVLMVDEASITEKDLRQIACWTVSPSLYRSLNCVSHTVTTVRLFRSMFDHFPYWQTVPITLGLLCLLSDYLPYFWILFLIVGLFSLFLDCFRYCWQEGSDLTKIFQMIAAKSKMSWIALSSSALLEEDTSTSYSGFLLIPLKNAFNNWLGVGSLEISKLDTYFENHTQHTVATLSKIMRNTNHITGGAQNVSKYCSLTSAFTQPRRVIAPGASHTVPGDKPDLVLCNWDPASLEASILFVLTDILKLAHHQQGQLVCSLINERVVVLVDGPKPREVATAIKILTGWGDNSVHSYDSGVEWCIGLFSGGWVREADSHVSLDDQRKAVQSFLRASTGVLVTKTQMFAGMENATILFITRNLTGGLEGGGVRSGMLRACSKLIVIVDRGFVSKDKAKEMFNVHDRS